MKRAPDRDRHLELISGPALASRLGVSHFTLQRRRDLPRPIRLAGRRVWFACEVRHLLRRRRYTDVITAEKLAALLFVSPTKLYGLIRAELLPPPTHRHGRAVWSRKQVERFLRALPRT